jgi:ectoine hydroxylase-related dioxygenase (phytanoyl-CoA dioxygenase family)
MPPPPIVQPEMRDGQAIVFDGRLWHASHNTEEKPRAALLLQYAALGTPILIPDYRHLEWPFRIVSTSPRSVLVSGKGNAGAPAPILAGCSADTLR